MEMKVNIFERRLSSLIHKGMFKYMGKDKYNISTFTTKRFPFASTQEIYEEASYLYVENRPKGYFKLLETVYAYIDASEMKKEYFNRIDNVYRYKGLKRFLKSLKKFFIKEDFPKREYIIEILDYVENNVRMEILSIEAHIISMQGTNDSTLKYFINEILNFSSNIKSSSFKNYAIKKSSAELSEFIKSGKLHS